MLQLLLPPLGNTLTPDVWPQLFRKRTAPPPLSPPLQKHVVSQGRPHAARASEADTPQIISPAPPEACNTLTLPQTNWPEMMKTHTVPSWATKKTLFFLLAH